jgi:Intracellular proteinase inhibitor
MRLEMTVPREVRLGDSVPIVLRLVNDADAAAEVALQGRPVAFDITVARRDGDLVWRRLEGEVVTAILQLRQLGPRETLTFRDTWNQRSREGTAVPPGDYLVTGSLPSDPPAVFRAGPLPLRIIR